MDMSKTIAPKSDQLNYDDFISGPRNITITGVKSNGVADMQPVSIEFEGDNNKPYKPCKSMRRVMVKAWGMNAIEYVGRSMTLFGDANVSFGGQKVGGIRISHMSHIEKDFTVALTVSKARRAAYPVRVLRVEMESKESTESDPGEYERQLGICADVASMGIESLVRHWKTLSEDMQGKLKNKFTSEFKPAAQKADEDSSNDDQIIAGQT